MKSTLLRRLLAALAVSTAVGIGIAHAAGVFQFPTVAANGQTGAETLPADTNLGSGINPATAIYSFQQLNLLPYLFVTLGTGVSQLVISLNYGTVVIDAASTITQVDVQFPPSPVDGQILRISSNRTITNFNPSPNSGQTISAQSKPTVITLSTTASFGYAWIYRSSNTTWYRIQ